jgi:hypothetical protein
MKLALHVLLLAVIQSEGELVVRHVLTGFKYTARKAPDERRVFTSLGTLRPRSIELFSWSPLHDLRFGRLKLYELHNAGLEIPGRIRGATIEVGTHK